MGNAVYHLEENSGNDWKIILSFLNKIVLWI